MSRWGSDSFRQLYLEVFGMSEPDPAPPAEPAHSEFLVRQAEQIARWNEEFGRAPAARRIRLSTALAWSQHVLLQDPYGEGLDIEPEDRCVGRQLLMCDAQERIPVLHSVVRDCHPELNDDEWDGVVDGAIKRERRGLHLVPDESGPS